MLRTQNITLKAQDKRFGIDDPAPLSLQEQVDELRERVTRLEER